MEQYKQITKKSTKKSTGLRKQLKRRKLDMNNATADDVYNECGVLCVMKCTLFFMLILLHLGVVYDQYTHHLLFDVCSSLYVVVLQ